MPALTNRPNGVKQQPHTGAKGNILIKTNGDLYEVYITLRTDDKAVMDSLLYVMRTNSNHFTISGDTIDLVATHSGYNKRSILNSVSRLAPYGLLMPTGVDYEYIVNPTFAIKGKECEIWKFIQSVEYCNNIPSDVRLDCSESTLNTLY